MIDIYRAGNENFQRNGDMPLLPVYCTVKAALKGEWSLVLEHPIDEEGRWREIVEEAVIAAPTFLHNRQLYRIYNIQKSDDAILAYANPIFWDAAKECWLSDVRPVNKTGQQALEMMCGVNPKYQAETDIEEISTAYYVRKNLIEAINGSDENSFLNRWGGEPIYDNYKAIINRRAGKDNGVQIIYGKNMNGVTYSEDMSNVITRIVPVAYNGRTLTDQEPWVDSPDINAYVTPYTREVKFEYVKLREDAQEADLENPDVIVCETQKELNHVLIEECKKQFQEGVDKPQIKIEVRMMDLSNTEEYKEFKELERVSLGDTVHCKNSRIGIVTDARVMEIEWDCINNQIETVTLGEYTDYFDHLQSITQRVDASIRQDGTAIAENVTGTLIKALIIANSIIAGRLADRKGKNYFDLDEGILSAKDMRAGPFHVTEDGIYYWTNENGTEQSSSYWHAVLGPEGQTGETAMAVDEINFKKVGSKSTKSGRAEFSDGSYMEFQNGVLVGGSTTEGGAID